jgi:hypothetical protein
MPTRRRPLRNSWFGFLSSVLVLLLAPWQAGTPVRRLSQGSPSSLPLRKTGASLTSSSARPLVSGLPHYRLLGARQSQSDTAALLSPTAVASDPTFGIGRQPCATTPLRPPRVHPQSSRAPPLAFS